MAYGIVKRPTSAPFLGGSKKAQTRSSSKFQYDAKTGAYTWSKQWSWSDQKVHVKKKKKHGLGGVVGKIAKAIGKVIKAVVKILTIGWDLIGLKKVGQFIRDAIGAVVRIQVALTMFLTGAAFIKPLKEFMDSIMDAAFPMSERMGRMMGYIATAIKIVRVIVQNVLMCIPGGQGLAAALTALNTFLSGFLNAFFTAVVSGFIQGAIQGAITGAIDAAVILGQGGEIGDAFSAFGKSVVAGAVTAAITAGITQGLNSSLGGAANSNWVGGVMNAAKAGKSFVDVAAGFALMTAISFVAMAATQFVMTGSVDWGMTLAYAAAFSAVAVGLSWLASTEVVSDFLNDLTSGSVLSENIGVTRSGTLVDGEWTPYHGPDDPPVQMRK